MAQALITYLLVAAATLWVVWSLLLPRSVRAALRSRLVAAKAGPAAKTGCDCGGRCGD